MSYNPNERDDETLLITADRLPIGPLPEPMWEAWSHYFDQFDPPTEGDVPACEDSGWTAPPDGAKRVVCCPNCWVMLQIAEMCSCWLN